MIWGDFALLHRTGKESRNEKEQDGKRIMEVRGREWGRGKIWG